MSSTSSCVSVSGVLSDAKRLSSRLREHDAAADSLLTAAGDMLKEIEAMRQFQEDLEQLNSVANQRPRAQLVLGIQQENRHIRQLQQENKELRATLEEHQNALELIMSKYRQHIEMLVNSTKVDRQLLIEQKSVLLQEKTDQICEMASIMTKSIQLDEEFAAKDEEIKSRLVTENKGLREMLEISRRNGSLCDPLFRPKVINRECQTVVSGEMDEESSTAVSSSSGAAAEGRFEHTTAANALSSAAAAAATAPSPSSSSGGIVATASPSSMAASLSGKSPHDEMMVSSNAVSPVNGQSEHESDSDDEEITFNTIKRRTANGLNGHHSNGAEEEEEGDDQASLVNGDKNSSSVKTNSNHSRDNSCSSDGDDEDASDSSSSVVSVIEASLDSKQA